MTRAELVDRIAVMAGVYGMPKNRRLAFANAVLALIADGADDDVVCAITAVLGEP